MTASDSTVHNVKRCVYVCVAFLSVCLCFLRHCLCVRCVVFFFFKVSSNEVDVASLVHCLGGHYSRGGYCDI